MPADITDNLHSGEAAATTALAFATTRVPQTHPDDEVADILLSSCPRRGTQGGHGSDQRLSAPSDSSRSNSEEALMRRFWHRFPWLVLGLIAAFAAAVIVAGFEDGLADHLELVFFIPGIVYIADAVGTQTETLVVRGLSLGIRVGSVMRRELLTGVLLGAVLGGLAYPLVAVWMDPSVALKVALAIFAASTVATGVAMLLPWFLDRLDLDPAFGSGPLSTVVQDLLSLSIYFSLAAVIVL